jgi:hypothetical protein
MVVKGESNKVKYIRGLIMNVIPSFMTIIVMDSHENTSNNLQHAMWH